MPLAAGLYGVLLGLGFTTFILTFAVWALAGDQRRARRPGARRCSSASRFGAGRALPVIALAPAREPARRRARTPRWPSARRSCAACAPPTRSRSPLCALALASDATPERRRRRRARRAQPQRRARRRRLGPHERPGDPVRGAAATTLPGRYPALATGLVAWREPDRIVVAALDTLAPVASVPAGGADALALSPRWLAWRSRGRPATQLGVFDLTRTGDARRARVAGEPAPAELGRPALAGDALLFHVATRTGSRIDARRPPTGARSTLRTERRALLTNPAALGGELLYVRSTYQRQQLRLGPLDPPRRPRRPPAVLDHPDRPARQRPREGPRPPPRGADEPAAARPRGPARASPTRSGPPRSTPPPPT